MNKRFVSVIYEFTLGATLAGKRVCQFINLQISPFFVVVVENKKKQSQDAAYVIKHTCFCTLLLFVYFGYVSLSSCVQLVPQVFFCYSVIMHLVPKAGIFVSHN
jgi:hypothetical protein